MSDRTRETIRQLALDIIKRAEGVYYRDSERADEMALNVFCGALALAGYNGDEELVKHLENVAFCISVRGMSYVRQMAAPAKAGAA